MGESVAEATLTAWLKEVGETVELDEAVFEIATDKVDSEVPSEVQGVLVQRLFGVDDVIKVGQTVAIIETETNTLPEEEPVVSVENVKEDKGMQVLEDNITAVKESVDIPVREHATSDRFYSPLVKNIAKQEGISLSELDAIPGTGSEGRLTKNDVLAYLGQKKQGDSQVESNHRPSPVQAKVPDIKETTSAVAENAIVSKAAIAVGDEVITMSRMGKLIAQHMVDSVSTSAHVQSFVEVDVTNIVLWRNKVKDAFEKREGEKLTFTPIFMEAVAKALKNFPMLNISVDGDKIIKRKSINIGMAAALPDGNLIVPVIKNADQLNLVGMSKAVNDLANRARTNMLKPDEVKDGTYTVTNVGSFGSVFGTPIINQPQVGILALGAIRKVPAVIETPDGDFIGIRSKMFLSHSYDHRVVNGALGGMFVKSVAEYLEAWDLEREI